MSRWLLYWVLKCDDMRRLCESGSVAAGACWVISGTMWFLGLIIISTVCDVRSIPYPSWCSMAIRIDIIVLIVVTVLWCILEAARHMLPSTKEMAVLLVVPPITNAVVNNEMLRRLPKRLWDLASEWIEMLAPQESARKMGSATTSPNKPRPKRPKLVTKK